MKKHLILILTILLILPAILTPKQEVHAASLTGLFNGWSWVSNKARDLIIRNTKDGMADDKDKKMAEKIAKKDKKDKAPKVSSDVSEAESKGSGVNDIDLSDSTMTPTVHYSAFQDKVSRFISVITVIGGFYLGVSILRSLGMFAISVAQLAMIPDFPKARYFLLKNLMVSMMCIALLGSVGLLTQLISGIVFHS